jgi:hypothetical protein
MVQRDKVPEDVNDIEQYKLLVAALEGAKPRYPDTPYGARKTAELDIQFSLDPSYGLTKERYGWYSDKNFFDSTNFTEQGGRIKVETSATSGDSARIRSAYPGQYVSHTIAEPGLGADIDAEHIERDADGFVSLTHGEISFEVSSVDTDTNTGINAHGISFEPDATYHQVRSGGTDVAKIPQSEWNIDKLNGDGPSGLELTPSEGYVYQFIYSWYGEGAMILAVEDPVKRRIVPVNYFIPDSVNNPIESPNLPVQAFVENKDTAESLSFTLGGMQYATHGKQNEKQTTRTTEEARITANGFIDTEVVTSDNAVDPFAETGRPLVAARRDESKLSVEKGMKFEVGDVQLSADQSCYIFVFDDFDTSGLDGVFSDPVSRNGANINETRLKTNTTCTSYTPSNLAVLRGIAYVPSAKKEPSVVVRGDTTSRVPLRATSIVTVALAPGANNTEADPALVTFKEGL